MRRALPGPLLEEIDEPVCSLLEIKAAETLDHVDLAPPVQKELFALLIWFNTQRLMTMEMVLDKLARVDRGDVAAARRCAARHLRLLRRRRDAQTAQRAKRRRAEARSCLSQRLSEHCGRPDAKEILSGQSPLPDTRRPSRELGLRLRLRLRKRGCGRERAAAQERGRAPLLLRSPHLSQRSKVIAITFSGKPSPASPFAVSCLNIAGLCKKN